MGEKIEFPKNYETYVNKGIEYFDVGNMQEAILCFKEAYTIKQEPKVNTFYTTALYQIGEYKKAKEIADEKLDFYTTEDNLTAFYVSILIKCHCFLQAERIVMKKLSKNTDDHAIWHSLLENIQKDKAQIQLENKKHHEQLLKNIFSMGNQSFEKQALTIKEANDLPLALFIKASTSILSNPFVNGIVKTTVIEYLIEQQIEDTFTLDWFGEQKVIKPTDLSPVSQNKMVQNAELILKEDIENNDPVLFQAIIQEANVHFMLLYPFIDDVIVSADQWVSLYLKRYKGAYEVNETHLTSKEEDKMEKWMNRLNDEIQNWI